MVKVTGKHLRRSLFLIKLQDIKKQTIAQAFSCELSDGFTAFFLKSTNGWVILILANQKSEKQKYFSLVYFFILTYFRPMFHLWVNQVFGFYKMFEKHLWKGDILSKNAGRWWCFSNILLVKTNYLVSTSVKHWSKMV